MGQCGRYACECGATAYRHHSGELREHKTKLRTSTEPTARGRGRDRVARMIIEDWSSNDKEQD
jgi:hypothetical protein